MVYRTPAHAAFVPSGALPLSGSTFLSRAVPSPLSRFVCPRTSTVRTSRRAIIRCEVSIADTFTRALENKFPNADISRVISSFLDAIDGNSLEEGKGTPAHQRATSYVSGLPAQPFIDDFTDAYAWASRLQDEWETIRDELAAAVATPDLEKRGNNVWVPPVVEAAQAYGPDWRTLVLQDREWDQTNTEIFPKTTALLREGSTEIPCVEAFFAKQAPGTGIKLHTDDCNFIMTMHLGLDVPDGKSWIEVGGERRYWENGKALVFNTSFYHQTMNESQDADRTVLLIRFWHPDLKPVERDAMSFLFELIAQPDTHPASLEAAEQIANISPKKLRNKRNKRPAARGRGFGN